MKIIVTGPAGAGKGSLARMLARDYDVPHISTGECLRDAIANGTSVGKIAKGFIDKGDLVPDEIVVDLVRERLAEPDCVMGYILDGFPRTLNQAELLAKKETVDFVIQIDVSAETVLARLGGRFVCTKCGLIHNKLWDKLDACKECGGELLQRDDDREEIILKRLETYNKEFQPILDFYKDQNESKILYLESKIENSAESIYEIFMQKYADVLDAKFLQNMKMGHGGCDCSNCSKDCACKK